MVSLGWSSKPERTISMVFTSPFPLSCLTKQHLVQQMIQYHRVSFLQIIQRAQLLARTGNLAHLLNRFQTIFSCGLRFSFRASIFLYSRRWFFLGVAPVTGAISALIRKIPSSKAAAWLGMGAARRNGARGGTDTGLRCLLIEIRLSKKENLLFADCQK